MPANTVRVSLDADARRFEQGFDRAQTKSVALGAAVGTMAANLVFDLAGRAVDAVKAFATDSVRAFSDLEQSVGGTEAVFGDARGAIDSFAETSAESIGLAESEFRTATTSIGGQLKRMTGDVDFAAEQSIIATQVAADLAATYGGTTAEAVTALGAAFRGEADPAERFNLNLKIGAVNAKAVELGLAATTSQVDEAARAQATLALIMEQSADAQGQFAREADTVAGRTQIMNARLEEQKAVIGEQLAPVYLQLMDAAENLMPVLGNIADFLASITGASSEAEQALADLKEEMGEDAASAETLFKAFHDGIQFGLTNILNPAREAEIALESLRDDMAAMSTDELVKARDGLEDMAEQMGWNTEVTQLLADAIDQALAAQMSESADRAMLGKYKPALEEVGDATGDLAEETDAAADAVAAFRDEQQQTIDPMFAYRDALRDQEEAQTDVDEARDEYGAGSAEHLAALESERRAWQKVTEAEIELAQTTGLTKEEFRRHLEEMGVFATDEIDAIIADFERVNAFRFASKRINVQTVHTSVGGTSQIGGVRAKGGRTKKGVPYLVGEEGEEVFVPDEDGEIIPNHEISRGGRPLAGDGRAVIQVFVAGSVITERELIDAIHQGLLEKQRSNGSLGLVSS